MFSSMANIFRVEELKNKVIFTLMMLVVFRFGIHIPVPGVDVGVIQRLFETGSLFGMLDLFSGGALSKFSLFAMSITPYINSSIIMQLMTIAVPTLEQWNKEGAEGRKKINQITRYGTVVIAFIQGFAMAYGLQAEGALLNPGITSVLMIALTLTAGTVLLMWIGEQMTEKGIGNGISLIIFCGIIARLPDGIGVLYEYARTGAAGWLNIGLFVMIAIFVLVFIIAIQQGMRKIPVQYAKRQVGRKMYGGQSSYLPLKVNQAGVIPVIFASSVLMFPPAVAQFIQIDWVQSVAQAFAWGTWLNMILYIVLIIFFTYFYTAVTFNVQEMSDNLKKYGGFIPGIRPGKPTSEYLDRVMSRITLGGAMFLAFVAITPNIIGTATGITGIYFGGTALLIVVGVALDTMKQIEAMVLMKHYQGFMK
jgi:preprotein translocase, SecY subunit